jgi:hypothetical protein
MLPAKRLRRRAVRCGAAPCNPPKPEALRPQRVTEGLGADFLRSQLRRIGLGHPLQARPHSGNWLCTAARPEPDCNRSRRSGGSGHGLQQAPQRGASPRRILVSLGHLLTAAAEPTPPQRSWISPLGARPLADQFQTTERRKHPARSVTFLRDPTIPISVTSLNDLTGSIVAEVRLRLARRLITVFEVTPEASNPPTA